MVKDWSPLRLGLVAAICVVGTALGVWKFIGDRDVFGAESNEMTTVLVATRYIPAFTVIRPTVVSTKDFPRGFVPPGSFHGTTDLVTEKGGPKFVSTVPIPEGQPLTRSFLAELEKNRGMASILPQGKVAVSFSVDRIHGVGGWIQPGDHIALFQTVRDPAQKLQVSNSTKLLLSTILVIAVDNSRIDAPVKLNKDTLVEDAVAMLGEGTVLTVLVNPPEAALLIQARDKGRLTAVLRPVGDDTVWSEDVLAKAGKETADGQ